MRVYCLTTCVCVMQAAVSVTWWLFVRPQNLATSQTACYMCQDVQESKFWVPSGPYSASSAEKHWWIMMTFGLTRDTLVVVRFSCRWFLDKWPFCFLTWLSTILHHVFICSCVPVVICAQIPPSSHENLRGLLSQVQILEPALEWSNQQNGRASIIFIYLKWEQVLQLSKWCWGLPNTDQFVAIYY